MTWIGLADEPPMPVVLSACAAVETTGSGLVVETNVAVPLDPNSSLVSGCMVEPILSTAMYGPADVALES